MACFKSSIFKKLIKGHEHKPFKANWLKKEPPLSTVTVYQSLWSCHCKREGKKEEKNSSKCRSSKVQASKSDYDGDCDGDWNTFIFHRFDSFGGFGPPGPSPVGSENFYKPFYTFYKGQE